MATAEPISKSTDDRTLDVLRLRYYVRERLRQARRRIRQSLALEGAFWVVLAAVGFVAFSLAIDWWFRPGLATRIILLAAGLAAVGYVTTRFLITPLRLPLGDLDLAALLDRRSPGIGQRIAAVLQLPDLLDSSDGVSPAMVHAAVRERAAEVQSVEVDSLFNARRKNWIRGALLGVVLLTAAFIAAAPGLTRLWTRRWLLGSNVRWPQQTYLTVLGLGENNELLVPRAEPLLLQVQAEPQAKRVEGGFQLLGRGEPMFVEGEREPASATPDRVSLQFSGQRESRRGNFTHFSGNNFRYELPPIVEPLSIHVTGGDDWLAPFQIVPVDRPTIASWTLAAKAPGASDLRQFDAATSEVPLSFLPKTELTMRLSARDALKAAELLGATSAGLKLERVGEAAYQARWMMKDAVNLEVRLTDRRTGLISKPYYLAIGLLNDREPRVTLRTSGIGRRVTPQARIPISWRAIDDFGLAEVALELESTPLAANAKANEKPSPVAERRVLQSLDSESADPPLEFARDEEVSLRERGLMPGSTLKLRIAAVDRCALGAQSGFSRYVGLQIVSPEELFYDILMRQREARARFAQAVKAAEGQLPAIEEAAKPADIAALVRTHQVLTRQTWQTLNQLESAHREMTLNDLGTPQARQLLAEAVIAPLKALHDQTLNKLRGELESLSAAGGDVAAKRSAALESQQAAVKAMQRILAQMSQWESFVDVTNQLKQVIKMQNDLLDETQKLRKETTDELFD